MFTRGSPSLICTLCSSAVDLSVRSFLRLVVPINVFFLSLLLSMSVHRVPSREEVCCVLACHLVPCCVVLPWITLASKVMVIFRTVLDAAVRFAPAPYSCSVLTVGMCLLPGAGSGSGGVGVGGGKSLFSWWLSPLCVWCMVLGWSLNLSVPSPRVCSVLVGCRPAVRKLTSVRLDRRVCPLCGSVFHVSNQCQFPSCGSSWRRCAQR